MTFKAHVSDGRLVLDESTDLPDRLEVDLVPVLPDDWDEDDGQRLHAALDESEDDVQAGRVRDAAEVLADLRRT